MIEVDGVDGEAGLPAWMFEECYQAVGDLAETVALVLPADHFVADESAFAEALREAARTAERGYLVARGVHSKPSFVTGPLLALICGFTIMVIGAQSGGAALVQLGFTSESRHR